MKMTLEFIDGHNEVVEDVYPSFMPAEESGDTATVCGIDEASSNVTDDIPLSLIKRIIWEA
jgi:hypothetical protein